MAITITKAKAKAPELPKVETEDLATLTLDDLADRYGTLWDQVEALNANPIFTQFSMVQKELMARMEAELQPDEEAELTGKHWKLEVSACGKKARTLLDGAISKIMAFVGMESFAAIAKVNVSDIEKYLTPDQVAQVLESNPGYTKNRKVVAKFLG